MHAAGFYFTFKPIIMSSHVFTFENDLAYDVVTYTSINNPTDTSEDYLGELTELGVVTAKTTKPLDTNSDAVSYVFVVEAASDSKPLARYKKTGLDGVTGYTVGQKDEDAMNTTLKFIKFMLANPNDPTVQQFNTLMQNTSVSLVGKVDAFFQTLPDYKACTFALYSMGIIYASKNPSTVVDDDGEPTYSLSTLVKLLGGRWPSGMQDITFTHCSISSESGAIVISATILFESISFETSQVGDNVRKVLGVDTHIKVGISIGTQIGLGIGSTRLSLQFDDFAIPVTGSDKIKVKNPLATLDINPLFKFVVFTLSGTIPFNINGEAVDLAVSLTVDNDELSAGAVIYAEKGTLLTLPGLKGVHIDEFGLGLGVFFKPPACAIGVEGKFHIGELASGNVISLDDDSFAIVAKATGEEIHAEYMAFNIPQLSLDQVMEIFTDTKPSFGLPIQFSNLSVRWVASFMDAVILPDGSVSPMGYAFSAAASIFSFGFYGDASVDLNNFVTANLEVSPINWNNVFKLTGDGKGYSIKIDKNGNPIPAHFIPSTQAEKDAVDNATTKPLVSPGGPVLIINTLSQPILHLNAKASLFELVNYDITADVNKSGITFELDYGAVLTRKMVCNLTDFHNFYGEFGYYIDKSIPLPTINGVNLGSIPLKADIDVHLCIKTNLSVVSFGVGGNFGFEGYNFSFGDFTASISISKISDLGVAIVHYIESNAKTIFSQLMDTAEHWAAAAGRGIVTGFDDAGKVMKNAFNKTDKEMTAILKAAGFDIKDIAKSLKNVFGEGFDAIALLFKNAGYSAAEIWEALKDGLGAGYNDLVQALKYAGFALDDITRAFQKGYNFVLTVPADFLKYMGVIENDFAPALKAVGYAAKEIAHSLMNVLQASYNLIASVLKAAGFVLSEITDALKDCVVLIGNTAIEIVANVTKLANTVATALKAAGYLAEEVAKTLKEDLQMTAELAASAMKQAGYAASEVKNAFEDLGGDFKSFADTAWGDTKYYLNPSHW